MLTKAPKEGSCGTRRGKSQAGAPHGGSGLTLRILLPGAEDAQRETRSRGPSHGTGPMSMLSSSLWEGSRGHSHRALYTDSGVPALLEWFQQKLDLFQDKSLQTYLSYGSKTIN